MLTRVNDIKQVLTYQKKKGGKDIYSYLYTEGFDRTIANVNIGRIQGQIKGLKNVAFRKNLQLLEKHKYITFKEYDRGLYEYTIC